MLHNILPAVDMEELDAAIDAPAAFIDEPAMDVEDIWDDQQPYFAVPINYAEVQIRAILLCKYCRSCLHVFYLFTCRLQNVEISCQYKSTNTY